MELEKKIKIDKKKPIKDGYGKDQRRDIEKLRRGK